MNSKGDVGVDLVVLGCDNKSSVLHAGIVICAWIIKCSNDYVSALIVQTIVQHLEECLEIFQRSSPKAEAVLAGGSPAAGRPSPAVPVEAARDLFELLMLVLRASAEAKKKGAQLADLVG